MTNQINANFGPGIRPAEPGGGHPGIGKTPTAEPTGRSFKDVLMEKIGEVNDLILDKDNAVEALATGKTENVAEVLVAVEKADQAFKALMQIRNKLVEAWKEIERMQI